MAGHKDGPRTIRPVTFQETNSRYRTVNDAYGMGKALIQHYDQTDPDYLNAAKSCLDFAEGRKNPELVRADFVAALEAAGVFVRES